MTAHPATAYWDRGVANVPDMTGARKLLDAHDLRAVCRAVGIPVPIPGAVVDVGCGTGRLAQLCDGTYLGFDIAPSAVDYCRARGLSAHLITGPEIPVGVSADLVTCISVFTHIGREERQQYLATFSWLAPELLVDIIPGPEGGQTRLWLADPDRFVADLEAAGYTIIAQTDQMWDDQRHRYFYVRQQG